PVCINMAYSYARENTVQPALRTTPGQEQTMDCGTVLSTFIQVLTPIEIGTNYLPGLDVDIYKVPGMPVLCSLHWFLPIFSAQTAILLHRLTNNGFPFFRCRPANIGQIDFVVLAT